VLIGNGKIFDEECLRNGVLKKIFVRKDRGCIEMFFVVCALQKISLGPNN
jgi:hypothetical protein